MEIESRNFGKIVIESEDIISFPNGIPGFLDKKEFVLIPFAADSPFIIMQSLENSNLAFYTIEPKNCISNYEFKINEKTEKLLKIKDIKDLIIINIVTLQENISDMTVNLAAPIVININTGLGKQIILDNNKYSVRYKIFPEIKKKVAE